jgi:protein TonB
MWHKIGVEKLAGLLLVLAMHGAVLYGAWSYRLLPVPQEAETLFVNFINPPPAQRKPEPPQPPPPKVRLVKPRPVTAPPQPVLVANAPVTSPAEPVAPPPPPPAPEPVVEAPPAPPAPELIVEAPPPPPAPVTLTSDLAVACPQRSAPEYPATSRRLNEQGRVVLRVELDETGRVVFAKVKESSGFKRLDEAGLAAVKQWHCNAPVRNGEAVRAVALQPFNFVLEGRR